MAIDNLGRNTPELTLGQLKSMISGLKVGPAKPYGKTAENPDSTSKLQELLSKFTTSFSQEVNESIAHIKKVVGALNSVKADRDKIKSDGFSKSDGKLTLKSAVSTAANSKLAIHLAKINDKNVAKMSKSSNIMSGALSYLKHLFGHRGSGYTHDIHSEKVLYQILNVLENQGLPAADLQKISENAGKAFDATKKKQEGKDVYGSGTKNYHDATVHLAALDHLFRKFTELSQQIEEMFFGFSIIGRLFGGMFTVPRNYIKDIREVGYITQGITLAQEESFREFEKTDETLKSSLNTNVDRDAIQKTYLKLLKAGVKDQKLALGTATAQLHTEKQLGMEADSLNDTFLYLSQTAKMGTMQLSQMGRNMREVAKSTGLVGDQMADVVQKSKEYFKLMKNTGTLNLTSSKYIMNLLASAKKLDVEEPIGNLIKAMSGGTSFFEASPETKGLIIQFAVRGGSPDLMRKMQTGEILQDPEAMKQMTTNMERNFLDLSRNFGISLQRIEDLQYLTPEQLNELNMFMKKSSGVTANEMVRFIQSNKEATKTLAEKLKEIDSDLKAGGLTEKEIKLKEKEQADLRATAMMGLLTETQSALQRAKSPDEAFKILGPIFEKERKNIEALTGKPFVGVQDAISKLLPAQISEMNKQLTALGKPTIDTAILNRIANGDEVGRAELMKVMEEINDGQTRIESASKILTPFEKMESELRLLNSRFQAFSEHKFVQFFNSESSNLVAIFAVLGTISAALASYFFIFKQLVNFEKIGQYISRSLPKFESMKIFSKIPSMISDGVNFLITSLIGTLKFTFGGTGGLFSRVFKILFRIGEFTTNIFSGIFTRLATGLKYLTYPVMQFFNLMKLFSKNIGITRLFTGLFSIIETVFQFLYRKIATVFNFILPVFDDIIRALSILFSRFSNKIGRSFTNVAKGIFAITDSLIANSPRIFAKVAQGAGAMTRAFQGIFKFLFRSLPFIAIAYDSYSGSIRAHERAMKKAEEQGKKLTISEEYAAKSAGMLGGIIDSLSFGLLGIFFQEQLDEIVDKFAQFIGKYPALIAMLGSFQAVLAGTFDVLKKAFFNMIGYDEIEKKFNGTGFMKMLSNIGDGFKNLYAKLTGVDIKDFSFEKMIQNLPELQKNVSNFLETLKIPELGTAIGQIMEILGEIIGTDIIPAVADGLNIIFTDIKTTFVDFVNSFAKGSDTFATVSSGFETFKGILRATGPVIANFIIIASKLIGFLIRGVGKFFEGFFSTLPEVFGVVSASWGKAVKSLTTGFRDLFIGSKDANAVVKDVSESFSELFSGIKIDEILTGFKNFGIVVARVSGFILRLFLLPVSLLGKSMSAIAKIGTAFEKLFQGDFSGFKDNLIGAFNDLAQAFFDTFEPEIIAIQKWFDTQFTVVIDKLAQKFTEFIDVIMPVLFKGLIDSMWNYLTGKQNKIEAARTSQKEAKAAGKASEEGKTQASLQLAELALENARIATKSTIPFVPGLPVADVDETLNELRILAKNVDTAQSQKAKYLEMFKEYDVKIGTQSYLMQNPKDVEMALRELPKFMEMERNAILERREKEFKTLTPQELNKQIEIAINQMQERQKQIINLQKEGILPKEKTIRQLIEDFKLGQLKFGSADEARRVTGAIQGYELNKMIKEFIEGGMQPLGTILPSSPVTKSLDDMGTDIESLNKAATEKNSIYTHDTHMEPILSDMLSKMDTAVAVQYASTDPIKTEIVSPELNDLTESSEKQSTLQQTMVSLLSQLVTLLQTEETVLNYEAESILATKTATSKTPNYHRAQSGRQVQTPAVGLNNVGYID